MANINLEQSGGGAGGTTLSGTGLARQTGICTELSGDVITSGSNATTLTNTGTAGTYTKVTTDAKGRVASGTTLTPSDVPGTGGTAGDGGYMFPLDADPVSVQGTATVIGPTGANQVIVWMFVCKKTITIRKVTFQNGTIVVAGSTANFGIYDINGNKLIDSGSFSTATATQTLVNTLGSPVTLYAGTLYYYAEAATNTTTTSANNVAYSNAANLLLIKNVMRHGVATNLLSAGALPPTLGSLSTNGVRTPCAVLFES